MQIEGIVVSVILPHIDEEDDDATIHIILDTHDEIDEVDEVLHLVVLYVHVDVHDNDIEVDVDNIDVHDEVDDDIVNNDVTLLVNLLIVEYHEIDEHDCVAIYRENMYGMLLDEDDDDTCVTPNISESLVVEEMVENVKKTDMQQLVIEVDEVVHEIVVVVIILVIEVLDANEYSLLDTQALVHIKFPDEIIYMNVIDIVYIASHQIER